MFERLLIANRGEIACRVIETARRLGMRCIAVYSDADEGARHVAMADEAYRIGPPPAGESYLDAGAILDAAARAGADAVHPGYGFLSENPDFAEACAAAGAAFVGPPAAAIRAMGSKTEAKRLLAKAGVPLVPGYHGRARSPERLRREAESIGWPVLIKASAGGGGRGMRVVQRAADFGAALEGARREARAAFGDEGVLLERFVAEARHVEVQVFADRHGNFVHLFERDCSAQRRYQKVVEEAPAPGLEARTRAAMYEAALAAARAIGYVGAGTVEFLLAPDGDFWFMEMNTRLQVEHPVTELVTGTDLVEWQLRVAAGEPLPAAQEALRVDGHAIEARLYAEDPARGFLPQSGRLVHLRLPEESGGDGRAAVRVDAGVRCGDTVSVHYDPLIAKVIAWGPDRAAAAAGLARALAATEVVGPADNARFLRALVTHPRFLAGGVHTRFIEEELAGSGSWAAPADAPGDEDFALAALAVVERQDAAAAAPHGGGGDPWSPWNRRDHWRLGGGAGERVVRLRAEGGGAEEDGGWREVVVRGGGGYGRTGGRAWRFRLPSGAEAAVRSEGPPTAADGGAGPRYVEVGGVRLRATVVADGGALVVLRDGRRHEFGMHDPDAAAGALETAGGLTAPMPGKVVSVLVEPGQRVREGEGLVVLEAMKMEHTLAAPADGIVEEVRFAPGDLVDEAAELVVLAAPSAP